jgi:hypothetical protein
MTWSSLVAPIDVAARIAEHLFDEDRPAVNVISGAGGIGRTTVLNRVARRAAEAGAMTLTLRMSHQDETFPLFLVGRLVGQLCDDSDRLARGGWAASHHPDTPVPPNINYVAAELTKALSDRPDLVVLIDDLQWIDQWSLVTLEGILHQASVRVVGTVRTPVPPASPGLAVFKRLDAQGRAELIHLRPLGLRQTGDLLCEIVQAKPHPALSERLHQLSGGIPGALVAAVDGLRKNGALRVVQHHAYLIKPTARPLITPESDLLAAVLQLPAPVLRVARAAAVLHPLGDQLPRLIAAALEMHQDAVTRILEMLVIQRVLRFVRRTGSWRFEVPLLSEALIARIGPYERRQLAKTAVIALWDGTASSADSGFIADQLAIAGRTVGARRAATELMRLGRDAMLEDGWCASQWLGAAADLITDRHQLAEAMLMHAVTCYLHGEHDAALRDVDRLMTQHADELSTNAMQTCDLITIASRRAVGDLAAVEHIASGDQRLSGASPVMMLRAAAASMLGRHGDAYAALEAAATMPPGDVAADWYLILKSASGALAGRPELLNSLVEGPGHWRLADVPHHRVERLRTQASVLLLLGETNRAEALLEREVLSTATLSRVDRVLLAAQRGHWDDALDQGRVAAGADYLAIGFDLTSDALSPAIASILVSRGRPLSARAFLADRPTRTSHHHLSKLAAAVIEEALGRPAQAAQHVDAGLRHARERGVVYGTEDLWLMRAELAAVLGDTACIEVARRELAATHRALGTSRSHLNLLQARVMFDNDRDAAGQLITLARAAGQPYPLARALASVVHAGCAQPALLREAYEFLGDLDALLDRWRLRRVMRQHEVAIPDRSRTVEENDRLLGTLVAEGLTNRRLAAVLGTSEKSVEGLLSRMFNRAGYHSRVELAAAFISNARGLGVRRAS